MSDPLDCTRMKIEEIPDSPSVEYDQGDRVLVWYDDLYDLMAALREALEEVARLKASQAEAARRAAERMHSVAFSRRHKARITSLPRVEECVDIILSELAQGEGEKASGAEVLETLRRNGGLLDPNEMSTPDSEGEILDKRLDDIEKRLKNLEGKD